MSEETVSIPKKTLQKAVEQLERIESILRGEKVKTTEVKRIIYEPIKKEVRK